MSDDIQFKMMVRYFYEEKGDPTRYVEWDAERCQKLMPAFFEAWSKAEVYTKLAGLAVKAEAAEE